jgi:hypothetical protein
MHKLNVSCSDGPELCAELIRRKILQRLKCPAKLINFNLAICCIRNGRLTFRYGHLLLSDVLGYWRTEDGKRKTVQRLIESWLDFQRNSGYRLQEIKRGGCKKKELTTYGSDHVQPAVEWIQQQVANDPEHGIVLPEVLIDRYLDAAIKRLPRTSLTRSKSKKVVRTNTITSRGETSISRDNLTPSEMCLLALKWCSQGFKVFPVHSVSDGVCSCKRGDCQNKGKHPRITGWQSWAEGAGENQIRELWRKYPDANVGIKTGGKLVVVDVDLRHWGHVEWKRLQEYYAIQVPETFRVKTGSGGFHLFFSTDKPLRSGELAKGIDFKGAGGFVIAAGSIHANGNHYKIEVNAPIAPIPQNLSELAQDISKAKRIEEGDRHNYLKSCARAMARDGLSVDEIYALLCERRRSCAVGKRQILGKELEAIAAWAVYIQNKMAMSAAA